MLEMKINEFTEELSSSKATPGGGGASALAGALSASLGSMVGNLTVNKKKYAHVKEQIESCLEKSESLRKVLL